jgi:alpha-beta hydrolase superfamily lysophospholipase
MLTVEKWLEERLSSAVPSDTIASRVARLVEPLKSQISVRWFSVPLASGVGEAALLSPSNPAAARQSLVILLHALGHENVTSEWSWVQAIVAKGVSVLAVEWDGHGESGSLWDVASATRSLPLILHKIYAEAGATKLSNAAKMPRSFLMGSSLGGTLALLAAARPEVVPLISGVIAVSPMVALAGSPFDGTPRKRYRGGSRALTKNRFRMGVGVDPFDQVRAFLVENIVQKKLLENIRVPVLWMHGAHDSLVPVSSAIRYMTRIPSALFAHIDEARGHKLLTSCPEAARYAARFIERCVDVENV